MYEVETRKVHFVGEKMFEDLDEAERYAMVMSQEVVIEGYLKSKGDLSDKALAARRNVILDFFSYVSLDFLRWLEGLGHVGEEKGKDYRVRFHPWWADPNHSLDPAHVLIPVQLKKYFNDLETKHGVPALSDAQKAWYAECQKTIGEEMRREYPSYLEEVEEAEEAEEANVEAGEDVEIVGPGASIWVPGEPKDAPLSTTPLPPKEIPDPF